MEEIFDDFLSDHDRHSKNKTLGVTLDGVAWIRRRRCVASGNCSDVCGLGNVYWRSYCDPDGLSVSKVAYEDTNCKTYGVRAYSCTPFVFSVHRDTRCVSCCCPSFVHWRHEGCFYAHQKNHFSRYEEQTRVSKRPLTTHDISIRGGITVTPYYFPKFIFPRFKSIWFIRADARRPAWLAGPQRAEYGGIR